MGVCRMILLISSIAIVSFLWLTVFKDPHTELKDDFFKDHYWGKKVLKDGEPLPKDDETIRPFKVAYDDVVYKDLIARLSKTRFVEPLQDDFTDGFNGNYLKQVVEYWRTKFDWKKQIDYLNSYDQFVTQIEGLNIHFVRIKPTGSPKVIQPVLLQNGWPSSYYQLYKVADIVKKPVNDVGIELVIPSRPGFGFSDHPSRPGYSVSDTVRIYQKLMKRLGHNKFIYSGGDWGAVEGHAISAMYPDNIEGAHFTMGLADLTPKRMIKMAVGSYFPKLIYSCEKEASFFSSPLKVFSETVREMGYFFIQSTKPDTLGAALIDSPAGLAAWYLEKYSILANKEFLKLKDGGLTRKLTLDELLTNIMIQWVSENGGYGIRYYKQFIQKAFSGEDVTKAPVSHKVPAGFSVGENEIDIGKLKPTGKYNIVKFDYLPDTGHFAEFENPKLFSEHLVKFIHIVRDLQKNKNQSKSEL